MQDCPVGESESAERTAVTPESPSAGGAVAVVDLSGAFVAPGLIDAHVHLGQGEPGARNARPPAVAGDSVWRTNAKASLWAGVTALRVLGEARTPASGDAPLSTDFGLSARPLIIRAGHALTRPGRYGTFLGRGVRPGEDLGRVVKEEVEGGAQVVKVILTSGVDFASGSVEGPYFTLDELRLVVRAAAGLGVPVAVHANGGEAIRLAVRSGVTSIEHGIFIGEEELRSLPSAGVRWVPTLAPLHSAAIDPSWSRADSVAARHRAAVRRGCELGVVICAGSDSGCPGVSHSSLAREMALLRRAGMSAGEVRVAATEASAALLGLAAGYGTLQPGARTDLVWFRDDPFEAVEAPVEGTSADGLVLNGRIHLPSPAPHDAAGIVGETG